MDSSDSRTLIVTTPFTAGYEYRIEPNGVLQCNTPGTPSVVWEGDYTFRVKSSCVADIAGAGSLPDGFVNVLDLLAIINSWGTCPTPSCCVADVANADGVVNVADLLAVINGWGLCQGCTGEDDGMPQSVQDCMDKCSGSFDPYTPDWNTCVNQCVQALCEAEIIDCD